MTISGIILFLITLSLVVIVHECGHLICAKLCGVECLEFSIGFGPKICTFYQDKKGTKYNLRLFLLGGFVQIVMQEQDKINSNLKSFDQLNFFKQFIILIAGTVNNILLSFILLFIINVGHFDVSNIGLLTGNGIFEIFKTTFVNLSLLTSSFFQSIISLLQSSSGLENLTGIIGIFDIANQFSSLNLGYQMYFIAIISLNIGIMNQFPLPMLDGGQILLHLWTKITKHPISEKVEKILYFISLFLIIGLFVFTFFQDLNRL